MHGTVKKISILFIFISFQLALSAVSISIASDQKPPSPDEYRVTELFQGKPAPVDLNSHPKASLFRTRLREGARTGPNFAGHFTIVEWGCGSSCLSLALVESSSGKVIFPDEISPVFFAGNPDLSEENIDYGLIYNLDSRLLIIHGIPSNKKNGGSYYYSFENDHFKLIKEIQWGAYPDNH